MISRLRAAAGSLALAVLFLAALPLPGAAQQTMEGWFHVVWGVPDGSGVDVRYLLTDDRGQTRELRLDEGDTRAFGGPLALDRKRVAVSGQTLSPSGRVDGQPVLVVSSISPRQPVAISERVHGGVAHEAPQNGAKPYVTILCRFADSTSVMPRPKSYYEGLLLPGAARPSLDHYWREVSEDRVNLGGSVVVGWYDLPDPKAAYFELKSDSTPDLAKLKWGKLVNDCAGKADPDIDFRQFFGINLQVNGSMTYSWGGSWTLQADGVRKLYPMTWMASWARQQTYAHEIGHSFGLPHSSGPYGAVYDSRWDMMSGGGRWETNNGQQDYVGVHTIAYHKEMMGWLPATQKYTAGPGTDQTVTLQRLATPAATGFLAVQIPLTDGTFYTVEARRFAGYDSGLPGEAVVIHKVNPVGGGSHALVVDPDDNRNPNDAGAMWTEGESFIDAANDLAVSVLSATSSSYQVRVVRGSAPVTILTDTIRSIGVVGKVYSDSLRASGGLGAFNWSVTSGALPNGVALDAASGALRGTPTATGKHSITITATSGGKSAFKPYSITVLDSIVIASDSLRRMGLVGTAYGDTLTATGGTGSFVWSVVSGKLPDGVSLDAASGRLSGTPTQAGSFRYTVRAVSSILSASKNMVVAIAQPITVSSDSLRAAGTMGAAYADSLTASGGTGSITWAISEGRLPRGLSLAGTGKISGVPEEAGTFAFTATATSGTLSATKRFVLTTGKPQLQAGAVLDHLLGSGALTSDQTRYLDLLGNRNGRLDVADIRAWLVDIKQINASVSAELEAIVKAMESAGAEGSPQPKPQQERDR